MVTGPANEGVLPPEVYQRLCRDLRRNGRSVLADLSGDELTEALAGGLELLKVSDDELIADGRLADAHRDRALEIACRLHREGAETVLISRGSEPASLVISHRALVVDSPHFKPADEHGAGNSMFAGVAIGIAAGLDPEVAVKLGGAAGALNMWRDEGSGQGTSARSRASRTGSGSNRFSPIRRKLTKPAQLPPLPEPAPAARPRGRGCSRS
jgi:1-phosphofructokinase